MHLHRALFAFPLHVSPSARTDRLDALARLQCTADTAHMQPCVRCFMNDGSRNVKRTRARIEDVPRIHQTHPKQRHIRTECGICSCAEAEDGGNIPSHSARAIRNAGID